MLIICGIILYHMLDSVLIISYAEDYVQNTQKKTYEELQAELQAYKNIHMLEAGFRTIDIIFGWNNVFSSVGSFCDSIINILENNYLWTPLKWTVIIGTCMYIGYLAGYIWGIAVGAELVELVDYLKQIPEESFPINNHHELNKAIAQNIKFKG